MLPVVTKWRAGTLSAGDFWQQHSEHRVAGLKAFIWTIGSVTDFDVIAQMYVGFIFVVITLVLVGDLLRISAKDHRFPSTAFTLPASSLLLFSLVQQENWFWATASLQLSLLNLCTVMLVWAFARWPDHWRSLTLAAGCAVLGMFMEGSGQVLWIIGALAIGLGPQTRRLRTPRLTAWILAALSAFAVYVWHLFWAASSVSAALRHPGRVALFAGACLGLPFASWTSPDWSAVVGWGGFVTLGAASWSIYRCAPLRFRGLQPFLLLATYGLLVSILIAIGRAGGNPQSALTSHYAFAPTLFWMGVVVVLSTAVQAVWPRLSHRPRTAGPRSRRHGYGYVGNWLCPLQPSRVSRGLRAESQSANGPRDVDLSACASARSASISLSSGRGTPPEAYERATHVWFGAVLDSLEPRSRAARHAVHNGACERKLRRIPRWR